MTRILSIVGSTATGKTGLALTAARVLAKKFPVVDILSVDSRQIYQEMEIGTGCDVPAEFTRETTANFPFFRSENIRLHGLSIIQPDQEWSVMNFRALAQSVIANSQKEHGVCILLGGTGFYRAEFPEQHAGMRVPPNEELRQKAAEMSVEELQNWAQEVASERFQSMNESDQKNPRRLLRAIEIGQAKKKPPAEILPPIITDFTIGLEASNEFLQQKIHQRVIERLENGFLQEVQKLSAKYPDQIWHDLPAFSATGYREARAFLDETISKEEMQVLWERRELQYAKRQKTWLKKYAAHAEWILVDQSDWQQHALQKIQAWFTNEPAVY